MDFALLSIYYYLCYFEMELFFFLALFYEAPEYEDEILELLNVFFSPVEVHVHVSLNFYMLVIGITMQCQTEIFYLYKIPMSETAVIVIFYVCNTKQTV